MNTLLGEVTMLNDVQYLRYRVAFKLRKLQKSFLFDSAEVSALQEVLHSAGVQGLTRKDEVVIGQLRSVLAELYSTLRMVKPTLSNTRLKEAQECCMNWLQMVFKCGAGHKIEAGALKLILTLFCGSKPADKARYIFSVLANRNGAVDTEGMRYFCRVTQVLATCHQEQLYTKYESLDNIFRECLVFVRSAEDIEEEEEDEGGIKRPWLSAFEFSKLFTTAPEPKFLDWMMLWFRLPSQEQVVHPVRCAVCTRKPIVSFRYQCTQCPNFNMCQMCFLKGRTTDKHHLSHKVLEFSASSKAHKSWHRLFSSSKAGQEGRVMDDKRDPFMQTPRAFHNTFDDVDTPLPDLVKHGYRPTSKQLLLPSTVKTHQPTIIRIGSGEAFKNGRRVEIVPRMKTGQLQSSPTGHISYASSCSSADSLSSAGCNKFASESGSFSAGSPKRTGSNSPKYPASVSSYSGSQELPEAPPGAGGKHLPSGVVVRRLQSSSSDSAIIEREGRGVKGLSELNKRLSMEVDQLLSELPVPNPPPTTHQQTGSLQQLQVEEKALQTQVNQLTDKREKLAFELQDLLAQVQHMHLGFVNMTQGGRASSYNSLDAANAPVHIRGTSAPVHIRSGSGSPPSYAPLPQPPALMRTKMEANGVGMRRVFTPPLVPYSTALLDPLVEFTPDQLTVDSVKANRLSVAW